MFIRIYIGLVLILVVLGASQVRATTQSLSAHITFDTVLSITNNSNIDFGSVIAGQAGTYTLSPEGIITATNDGVVLGGTPTAGDLTITGSTTQSIDISADNYVADNGVTPSAATCNYNDGTSSPCTLVSQLPPGAATTLLVGVTLAVDGTQEVNTSAAPTFDIVVSYN